MRKFGFAGLFWGLAIAMQALVYLLLPSFGSGIFLSPDETAVAIAARSFGEKGTMRLEDPLLDDVSWVRPRSWVTQGAGIVPVGFLGMPVLLGIFFKLFGELPFLIWSPLLVLSVIYPLWRFLQPFGRWGRIAGIATWLSFPTVILYANRGLFPNLTVVCFSLWAAWLVWEHRKTWKWAIAGFLVSAALTVRPIEAVWVLPWMGAAIVFGEGGWKKISKKDLVAGLAGMLPPLLLALFAAWKTYGSPFVVGYFLRDTVPQAEQIVSDGAVSQNVSWPFGFHPRRMWANFQAYVVGFMGPWFAAAVVACLLYFKKRPVWPMLILGAWTLGIGTLVYGQALYVDHVDANVTAVGNSFLRYLLPVVPFFALAVAAVGDRITQSKKLPRGGLIVCGMIFALAWLGNWTAIKRDDEGLYANQQELFRYASIRAEAQKHLSSTAIVLSDRSDKIFFPSFRSVSPLPSTERVRELVEGVGAEVDILLFSTTLDEKGLDKWHEAGLNLYPIFESKNQSLYIFVTFAEEEEHDHDHEDY